VRRWIISGEKGEVMADFQKNNVYAVILGGGKGTRFWPLSRDHTPKQLLKIVGAASMVEQTIERIMPIIPREQICLVADEFLTSELRAHLRPQSKVFKFIVEPEGKNTAPAIGLAALYIKRYAVDPVMVVLPADHFIQEEKKFREILEAGIALSLEDYLVTLGIKPLKPETGYGYIKKKSERLNIKGQKHPASRAEKFVEKPDLETARKYFEEGGYYWNSGIFIWKTSTLLKEMERFMPDLYSSLMKIDKVIGTGEEEQKKIELFAGLEAQSIDYGVVERSDKIAVIPADIGWNDVGSFSALYDISEKDSDGNVISGKVIQRDTKGSLIFGSENRLLAVLGLCDKIVIDTDDATLVCSQERAQDVKKIVDDLKQKNAVESVSHTTVFKQWGTVTTLAEEDTFKVSKIIIKPEVRASFQGSDDASRQWIVPSGGAMVEYGDVRKRVQRRENIFIPSNEAYSVTNEGKEPLEIIEIRYVKNSV
jgi:mannose-1-phosphate guanylyltransferase/mannose-6-phosphate isomerase